MPRLVHRRLGRPTPLPEVIVTSAKGRYLHRLRRLFGQCLIGLKHG
jgi:hypothetical protein